MTFPAITFLQFAFYFFSAVPGREGWGFTKSALTEASPQTASAEKAKSETCTERRA